MPLQEHPERVVQYVERGYFSQITAASLAGGFGSRSRKTAEYLLTKSAVHVVASDTHSKHGLREPWPVDINKHLEKLVGEDAEILLVYENPSRIVNGENPLPVEPLPKRSLFLFFGSERLLIESLEYRYARP